MDEPESYSSSIYPFWMKVYESNCLKELFFKLKKYSQSHEERMDHVESYPPPWTMFYSILEREIFFYEKSILSCSSRVELIHIKVIDRICTIVEENNIFLKNMTLTSYQKIIDQLIHGQKLTHCRMLILWYFTNLLLQINTWGYQMNELFYGEIKLLID